MPGTPEDRVAIADQLLEILDTRDVVTLAARCLHRLLGEQVLTEIAGMSFADGPHGLMSDHATAFAMAMHPARWTFEQGGDQVPELDDADLRDDMHDLG